MAAAEPRPSAEVVVVGASAGGVEALREFVGGLRDDFPAAVFVVQHVAPQATSALPAILGRAGALPAAHAEDGEAIEGGRIYIAPPDCHLLVEPGYVRIQRGPRVNGHRPAVDILFRSAAHSYDGRVAGVVLSGALDDGTVGLAVIKRHNGTTLVQNPDDALYRAMPQSAIDFVRPDYVLSATEIAGRVGDLAVAPQSARARKEARVKEGYTDVEQSAAEDPQPGVPSGYTCPECSGALWESRENGRDVFRCRVGHVFSSESLLAQQEESVEAALWAALRALEERAALLRRLADRMRSRGTTRAARMFEARAEEAVAHAALIHDVVHTLGRADVDEVNSTT